MSSINNCWSSKNSFVKPENSYSKLLSPVTGSTSGTAITFTLGLPSYIFCMRPMTSCTLHLVAICISLQFLPSVSCIFLCLASTAYLSHNLSRIMGFIASSIPPIISSTSKNLEALTLPAFLLPTDVHCTDGNDLYFPTLNCSIFAFVLVTERFGKISFHVYSSSFVTISYTPS